MAVYVMTVNFTKKSYSFFYYYGLRIYTGFYC